MTTEITTAPQTHMAVTPADLLRMAVESGADLDKLEKLMALQERWEAGEAKKAFVQAMVEFKAEPLSIGKNKHVKFGNTEYSHAELVDVTEAIVPRLAKCGLSHDWSVSQDGGTITVTCTITHRLGHSKSVSMSSPADTSGAKNAIQAIASAKTYLERYTLLAITGAATGGQDDDGAGYSAPVDAYDPSGWLDAIADASDKDQLESLANQLREKGASIPDAALLTIRKAWAARAKVLA